MAIFTFYPADNCRNYWLHSAYDPGFVADLKDALEIWERRWDTERRLWWISRDAFKRAAAVCLRYGEVKYCSEGPDEPKRHRQEEAKREYQEQQRRQREQEERERRHREEARRERERESWRQRGHSRFYSSTATSSSDPYRVLHLQPDAPLEVVRAVYRALALIHHPDKGGDVEQMKRVNVAHDEIMRQRGER